MSLPRRPDAGGVAINSDPRSVLQEQVAKRQRTEGSAPAGARAQVTVCSCTCLPSANHVCHDLHTCSITWRCKQLGISQHVAPIHVLRTCQSRGSLLAWRGYLLLACDVHSLPLLRHASHLSTSSVFVWSPCSWLPSVCEDEDNHVAACKAIAAKLMLAIVCACRH